MFVKNKKGFYQIKELLFPDLVHGFSTKQFGNLSHRYSSQIEIETNQAKFALAVGFDSNDVIKLDLVHGTRVAIVTAKDKGKIIPDTDALITADKNVVLWLLTGDCPPYILFDQKQKVIAVAHSGWMGTVGKIVPKTVAIMVAKFGCQPKDILVGVGPSIEKCCYFNPRPNIQESLPEWKNFVFNDNEEMARIDLNGFTIKELEDLGIPRKNIFYSQFCTKDHSDEFFCSQQETAGEAKPGRFATIVQMT